MVRRWHRLVLYYVGGLVVAGAVAFVSYWLVPSPGSIIVPFASLAIWWVLLPLMEWSGRRTPKQKKFSAHPQGDGTVWSGALSMTMPAVQARHAAEDAVKTVPRARLVQRRDWQLVFRVPGSWKTFGEEVRIDIEGHQAGTRVHVSSRLVIPSLADYGKNQANVDTVMSALEGADQRYRLSRGTAD
jgi:hypothetical protein